MYNVCGLLVTIATRIRSRAVAHSRITAFPFLRILATFREHDHYRTITGSPMVEAPDRLIEAFCRAHARKWGERIPTYRIRHEHLAAPHTAGKLPAKQGALYVFSLPASPKMAAGPNRALKVGIAGPHSNSRFQYQHYKAGSAKSTLAGAIENNPILHDYIGFDPVARDSGEWIRRNTDRDNFFIHENRQSILPLFEVYVKACLGPMFEGSLSG